MRKNNIIKILVLLLVLILVLTTNNTIEIAFPFTYSAILPLSAYIMNKYIRKNNKKPSLYNMITLFLTIVSACFIGYMLVIYFQSLFAENVLDGLSGINTYFTILLIIMLLTDTIINFKTYKNNILYPVLIIIILIYLRLKTGLYLYEEAMFETYYNNNIFLIVILLLLVFINGIIEHKQTKISS